MEEEIGVATTATRRLVNGVALHCVEAGPQEGPLVILLHGFPEFWWSWRRQIAPLARAGFRVVAPDQRGYNLSDRPDGRRAYRIDVLAKDVTGLIRDLGRESCHLVGHDWGGLVAWRVASHHPGCVERLAVINAPHPDVVGPYMRSHPLQIARSSYVGFFQVPHLPEWILAGDGYRRLKDALRRTSRPGTFTDTDLARYEEAWSRPGALTAMLNWYRALPLSFGRAPAPAPVVAPTLVIWGEGDRFLEKGLAQASLALCRTPAAAFIETGTHWVHQEEAERVNRTLLDFLRH